MGEMALDIVKLKDLCGIGEKSAPESKLDKFRAETNKTAAYIASAPIVKESPRNETVGANDNKPLILAADDRPELLAAVAGMLADRFRVMGATNGLSALRLIEKHPPVLFLLDIEMPQMDGYKLAEKIRMHPKFEHTPIIFLTSKNTRDDVISAIRRGGNDYLVKPVNRDVLINKILRHLSLA